MSFPGMSRSLGQGPYLNLDLLTRIIHSTNKHKLSTYYVLRNALRIGDTVTKQTYRVSALKGRAFSKHEDKLVSERTRTVKAIRQGYEIKVRTERWGGCSEEETSELRPK